MWSIELRSDETAQYVIISRDQGTRACRTHWFRGSPRYRSISWESIERVLALVARAASHKYLHADGWEASGEDGAL